MEFDICLSLSVTVVVAVVMLVSVTTAVGLVGVGRFRGATVVWLMGRPRGGAATDFAD